MESLVPLTHKSGCLACGAELVYLDRSLALACVVCGEACEADVHCCRGHYVCDRCHASGANDWIEKVCARTSVTDPWALAGQLMHSPLAKMHGPEYHFLVPAVLLACYANLAGRAAEKPALVAKARKRAERILGGFCGTHGICGAGVGTGIFVSVANGATPLTTDSWRLINLMSSMTLRTIAIHGGPRCCKRDTYLALAEAAEFCAAELGIAMPRSRQVTCEFAHLNKECLAEDCPYFVAPAGERSR